MEEQEKLELETGHVRGSAIDSDSLRGAIEAIVFMSAGPVSADKIKNLIDENIPDSMLKTAIADLELEYAGVKHGIEFVQVAGGYQFVTKKSCAPFVQKLFKAERLELTPSALEVLAIVAYKQPVSKADISKIRGVDSGHLVRSLMDRRLVGIAQRSQKMGRMVQYKTTPEFLQVFNLASIEDLPPEYELEDLAKDEEGPSGKIKTLIGSADKPKLSYREAKILEELAVSIKRVPTGTDFTSTLKENEGNLSAFDVLENHLARQRVAQANSLAALSEPVSPEHFEK